MSHERQKTSAVTAKSETRSCTESKLERRKEHTVTALQSSILARAVEDDSWCHSRPELVPAALCSRKLNGHS